MLKPEWLRVKAPQRERIGAVADLLLDLNLNTVCQEASCPNIGEASSIHDPSPCPSAAASIAAASIF